MDLEASSAGTASLGESRWPMALAVLATGALHAMLPDQVGIDPPWVYMAGTGLLLLVLVIGDPGRIDRQRTWLRVLTDVLIGLITVANVYVALQIVVGILTNNPFWNNAGELLLAGGLCSLINVIAFALWYWDLDRGGPVARSRGLGTPAFVFPEMNFAHHVKDGWYPTFVDYLAFSFNTAMAFSPTDVSAIRPWAKVMMMVEAAMSLGLAALVVARAVNVLN